ncbi:hypothetical protein WJX75_001015 [Coccomyxa subellipsoidea]|uniref:Uncharacterized protein n=1 Tax=Coccomyxa subellipsoidea TaxID=248742 RepID=A0ABR2YYX3_9CHLO
MRCVFHLFEGPLKIPETPTCATRSTGEQVPEWWLVAHFQSSPRVRRATICLTKLDSSGGAVRSRVDAHRMLPLPKPSTTHTTVRRI